MHHKRVGAAATAALLLTAGTVALTVPSSAQGPAGAEPAKPGTSHSYVVLLDRGAGVAPAVAALRARGATITGVNRAIGMVTVSSKDPSFRAHGAAIPGVQGVARNRSIGAVPAARPDRVERENLYAPTSAAASVPLRKHGKPGKTKADPLDGQLWGMRMIGADKAHGIDNGAKNVRVGIIDTGVDASNPDLAPNFDWDRSRNFTTDMPDIDGPCEYAGCVDPVGVDDGGHGTHVAGTVAASLNGLGVSGVAPKVDLVEIRAGQDSGYFFLQPTIDALTYAADAGIDVVNMSFYIDPWLYNCQGGAPEDSPEQAAEQDTIIAAVGRALDYAHDRNVTMVAALGNNHEDVANPRVDTTSPDYGAPVHDRTIDNATCFDLPVEGSHVIGVSALGPSGGKSDYSNYTSDLRSGELELSAPGGYFRDGLGTPTYRTNANMILSTYPLHVLQEEGQVDANGDVTPAGAALGTQKQCTSNPYPGADSCAYYTFLQGTSMASPHVAGVAALAVSRYGHGMKRHGFGLDPDVVARVLARTATDHACPPGGTVDYTLVGRPAEYNATCVGPTQFNGFYGAGIVNAYGVVR